MPSNLARRHYTDWNANDPFSTGYIANKPELSVIAQINADWDATTGLAFINNKPTTITQAGTVGPVGPAGVAGPVGVIGSTGSTGIQGIQGLLGPAGQVGAQGIQGPSGVVNLPSLVWTALPIVNSNTSIYSTASGVPQYAKSSQGIVFVRGSIASTGSGGISENCQLPVGFRPSSTRYVIGTGTVSYSAVMFVIVIGTDGGLTLQYPNYGTVIQLDAIEFPVN